MALRLPATLIKHFSSSLSLLWPLQFLSRKSRQQPSRQTDLGKEYHLWPENGSAVLCNRGRPALNSTTMVGGKIKSAHGHFRHAGWTIEEPRGKEKEANEAKEADVPKLQYSIGCL
jgi:hypothetical protein